MGRAMQERIFEHIQTAKAQISLCCPLTESLDTTECINGEQRLRWYFAHAQDDLHLCSLRMLETFPLDAAHIILERMKAIDDMQSEKKQDPYSCVSLDMVLTRFRIGISSPGLCPWRAYVITQSLASASVSALTQCLSFHSFFVFFFCFFFFVVFFNYLRYCFHLWPTLTLG